MKRLLFSFVLAARFCRGGGGRTYLGQKNLAPSTINVRLAAVRRLAYEASDSGLLSPELAAGIARVKGAERLGVRIGNWLTADQGKALLKGSHSETLRGKGTMRSWLCFSGVDSVALKPLVYA